MISHDKNGLAFSSQSDSGYKFVTTLFDGPLVGKFIAFAKVPSRLQGERIAHGASFDGSPAAFGYNDTLTLGIFDDVRDAAFVAQSFNGKSPAEKDDNLEMLFMGLYGDLATPPTWNHPADQDRIEGARKRAAKRGNADVQVALAAFYADHGAAYKVSAADAKAIRAAMNAHLGTISKPNKSDALNAAALAFEPFKK